MAQKTLNELIVELQNIRDLHGGDLQIAGTVQDDGSGVKVMTTWPGAGVHVLDPEDPDQAEDNEYYEDCGYWVPTEKTVLLACF